VPKDVSEVITKREFKRKLGESERAALAAYPGITPKLNGRLQRPSGEKVGRRSPAMPFCLVGKPMQRHCGGGLIWWPPGPPRKTWR